MYGLSRNYLNAPGGLILFVSALFIYKISSDSTSGFCVLISLELVKEILPSVPPKVSPGRSHKKYWGNFSEIPLALCLQFPTFLKYYLRMLTQISTGIPSEVFNNFFLGLTFRVPTEILIIFVYWNVGIWKSFFKISSRHSSRNSFKDNFRNSTICKVFPQISDVYASIRNMCKPFQLSFQ